MLDRVGLRTSSQINQVTTSNRQMYLNLEQVSTGIVASAYAFQRIIALVKAKNSLDTYFVIAPNEAALEEIFQELKGIEQVEIIWRSDEGDRQ
jgi:hypothetical protein